MPKLLYITPVRMPTEKAHGLQIVENCDAFADAGWTTELWAARRWNRAMRAIDVHDYYGVEPNFAIRYMPTIDLMPLASHRPTWERIAHYVILISFTVTMLCRAVLTSADVIYTRDPLVALSLTLVKRRSAVAYEVHTLASSKLGARLQRAAVTRSGNNFAISERLRTDLAERGGTAAAIHLARDAVRESRFADSPERIEARADVGWPSDTFIVGYVGRLHTMGIGKGVETAVRAVARLPDASIALVGGPDDMAAALRREWQALGRGDEHFLYPGHVAPHRVPVYLRALDVCVAPYPAAPYFERYMSPLKLFEYMASGRPIVASDLPAISEILEDGKTALLPPAGDVDAMTRALERLQQDEALRETLAAHALAEVMQKHTWAKRAKTILEVTRRG